MDSTQKLDDEQFALAAGVVGLLMTSGQPIIPLAYLGNPSMAERDFHWAAQIASNMANAWVMYMPQLESFVFQPRPARLQTVPIRQRRVQSPPSP